MTVFLLLWTAAQHGSWISWKAGDRHRRAQGGRRDAVRRSPGVRRLALGGDKGYDAASFVADMRALNVTPHINALYFTAGPNGEQDGLFGALEEHAKALLALVA
jgi:hypothetical protein